MKSKLDMEHFAAVVERHTTPLLEDSMGNEEEGCEMNTKHTPGPWRTEYGMVYAGDERVAFVPAPSIGIAQREANAALIAAAPVLREACTEALEYMVSHIEQFGWLEEQVVDRLRAALYA